MDKPMILIAKFFIAFMIGYIAGNLALIAGLIFGSTVGLITLITLCIVIWLNVGKLLSKSFGGDKEDAP